MPDDFDDTVSRICDRRERSAGAGTENTVVMSTHVEALDGAVKGSSCCRDRPAADSTSSDRSSRADRGIAERV